VRKLSEKEKWLFDYILTGPRGFRTFGEITQAHDLKYRYPLTNNHLKVLVYNLREHGHDIRNVRTFGYEARRGNGEPEAGAGSGASAEAPAAG
jgi:hypothetical protein